MRKKNKWRKSCIGLAMAVALAVTGMVPTTMSQIKAASQTPVITSMAYDDGPTFTVSGLSEGSFGFRMPFFNGGANVWGDVASDLGVNVKVNGAWVDIGSVNEYVYNRNWGYWSDGGANGFWFKVKESTNIQLYSKSNPKVTLDYNMIFNSTYHVYANGSTKITADLITGAAGVVFPYLGGTQTDNLPTQQQIDNFEIQYYSEATGSWIPLKDSASSGWFYMSNGYDIFSSNNQWGYFYDHVYGLWFRPVKENFKLRIGYPENGLKGAEIGSNYVEYEFVGAPNAYRPTPNTFPPMIKELHIN